MSTISEEIILSALEVIPLPSGDGNIVEAGWINNVLLEGKKAALILEPKITLSDTQAQSLQKKILDNVQAIKGINSANVIITQEATKPASPANHAAPRMEPSSRPPPPTPKLLPNIKHVIAVASGKGGVGKSTVAVNIAVTLARTGHKVGLVDADIYGPSVPHMLNLKDKPEVKDNAMIPCEAYGVKAMSMGLLLDKDAPVVWRGPMATKALNQLIRGADWGNLDYLIIDLPPGTGDIHLSIVQNVILSGAVVVSTPQEVALLDVRKALGMFEKVSVPILGVVENMSYFQDSSGIKHYMFGQGNITKLADELTIPVLAHIPIVQELAAASDQGEPLTRDPKHSINLHYEKIAKRITEILDEKA